jgi:hypothetical protein
MTSQNTFTNSMQEYFGITKGPTGSVEIFSDVVVENKLTVQGITGCYVRSQAGINSSFIDFGSTIGGGTGIYDSRIISFAPGGPSEPNNLAFQTDGDVQVLAPLRAGAPNAPAFKVDYSSTAATPGVNEETTITFTPGLFTVAPTVVATANTPTGSTGDQSVHVEEVTASGFKVEYLGTAAAGTFINWIALGV